MCRFLLVLAFLLLNSSTGWSVDTLQVKPVKKITSAGEWTRFPSFFPSLRVWVRGLEARDGSLWWGAEDGAIRQNETVWVQYTDKDGLMDGGVRGIVQSQDGVIWFMGSHQEKAAVTRFDGEEWRIYPVPDGLGGAWVAEAAIDGQGNIWMATQKTANVLDAVEDSSAGGYGVLRFDGQSWRSFTVKDGLVHNRVYDVMTGPDGSIWVGTYDGMSHFDGQVWTNYGTSDGMGAAKVYRIVSTRHGKLWCTHGEGLGASVFDGTKWIYVSGEMGMPVEYVRAGCQAVDGSLWFGTHRDDRRFGAKGLIRYQNGMWLRLLQGSGLPEDHIHGLTSSRDGSLWLKMSNAELVHFRPDLTRLDTLEGTLVRNKTPWSDVTVHAQDHNNEIHAGTISGENGQYRIAVLPGDYRILAGYKNGNEQVLSITTLSRLYEFMSSDDLRIVAISSLGAIAVLYILMFGRSMLHAGTKHIDYADSLRGTQFEKALQSGVYVLTHNLTLGLYAFFLYLDPAPSALEGICNLISIWYIVVVSTILGWERFIRKCDDISYELRNLSRRIGIPKIWVSFLIVAAGVVVVVLPIMLFILPVLMPALSGFLDHRLFTGSLMVGIATITGLALFKRKRGAFLVGLFSLLYMTMQVVQFTSWNDSFEQYNPFVFVIMFAASSSVVLILVHMVDTEANLMDNIVLAVNEKNENTRKVEELEQARSLQLAMLPQEPPNAPHVDIAWYMETATEVGGDYYDYTLHTDGTLTVVLGDATGHGLQAGSVVTASKSLFRSLGNNPNIVETFSVMSRSLKEMGFSRLAMAMTMVKILNGQLTISSAGIPPVLLYHASTKNVEEILLEGMPLGASSMTNYQQVKREVQEGDTILLMSDGLPERQNNKGELLGYEQVRAIFQNVGEQSPDEICRHMAYTGEVWAEGREQSDDITFVALKMK